jgi:hypothetical protein
MGVAKGRNADLGRSKLKIRLGELAAGTLLLSGFALILVWLLPTAAPPEQKVPQPDRYFGSIVIPTENDAQCRRLTFDNRTGSMKDQGIGACSTWPDSPARFEVLSAIANSFRGK